MWVGEVAQHRQSRGAGHRAAERLRFEGSRRLPEGSRAAAKERPARSLRRPNRPAAMRHFGARRALGSCGQRMAPLRETWMPSVRVKRSQTVPGWPGTSQRIAVALPPALPSGLGARVRPRRRQWWPRGWTPSSAVSWRQAYQVPGLRAREATAEGNRTARRSPYRKVPCCLQRPPRTATDLEMRQTTAAVPPHQEVDVAELAPVRKRSTAREHKLQETVGHPSHARVV